MLIFCNTQTTVERQYFSAIKKYLTWNCAQTWVTKIQWRLVTVIPGGAANPPNKDFIKTENHQVFHAGTDSYDV